MEESFKSVIDKSKSLLILLPARPRLDQVAAGLSLYLVFKGEKQVQISSPDLMTVGFNRLIGVDKVMKEVGDKNLIISFQGYRDKDIEKVSWDIEGGQFQLTVIPKQNVNPPTREQVKLSYSGMSADCVILIGGANESNFPAISSNELASVTMLHIGVRDISLPSNKSYISFSRPASSVSEVVYSLIKESGMSVDADVATNLLMGVDDGSSGFSASEVSAETFLAVSELMKAGGRRSMALDGQRGQHGAIPSSFPPRQMPSVYSGPSTQNLSRGTGGSNDQEKTPPDWLEPKIFKGTSTS